MRKSLLVILMTLCATALFPHEQALAQERIRTGVAGGLSIVPVWIMQDKGRLQTRRVSTELVQIASSPKFH